MEKVTEKNVLDILDELILLDKCFSKSIIDSYNYNTQINKILEYLNTVEIVHSKKKDLMIFGEVCINIIERSKFNFDTFTAFIENLIQINYFAYIELMLKEISAIMHAEYIKPLSQYKTLYVISKKDMNPILIHKDTHTIDYLATFRSEEDANRALEICTLWGKIRR